MPRYGNNIYKRADGRFEGRYIKSCSGGKTQYGYIYSRNYNEVKTKLDAVKSMSVIVASSKITMAKYLLLWLEEIKPNIKESTYMLYLHNVNNHLIPAIGKIKLQAVTAEQITALIRSKSELAPKTIYGIFGVLNSALSYAVERRLLAYNPRANVRLPKLSQKSVEVFTSEQQARLESSCDIGIMICLYTGLRIGEVCSLKWGDIDLRNGTLHVRRTVQRIKNTQEGAKTKVINTPPKTQFSERNIPIPQFLIDRLLSQKNLSDAYVLSIKGRQMEPRTYQYRFKKLLQRLGLPPLPFHSLRHTFSTRALELGFDVKTLSDILGHYNANITLRTYAHSIMEHKRTQMNLLSNLQK